MCGINGFLADPLPTADWFEDAVRAAEHRGPDAAAFWQPRQRGPLPLAALSRTPQPDSRAMLALSRLAILDPTEAAMQPMTIDGDVALAMNGEVYNYVEVREELVARGWSFRSSGDAEVLLKAYLQWGTDALERLDGMWALALYDGRRNGLLLSRDRFGEKPLFWTAWRGGIAFASEVKQLRRYPGLRLELDTEQAARYVVTGRPYDGLSSWFLGVRQLEPGGWMWIDDRGSTRGRYFDLRTTVSGVDPEQTPAAWAARFGEALSQSVRLKLRSDVPVGTSLSAGIDSSAVLAEALEQGHEAYHAFTAVVDDPELDESREAAAFARRVGARWHGVRADGAEFASLWDRMTWHHETPLPTTSLYGQWKIFEAARAAGVRVVLDGQGADEVLGGYHKFVAGHVLRTVASRPHRAPQALLRFAQQVGGLGALRTGGYRYLGHLGDPPHPERFLRPGLPLGESAPSVRGGSRRVRIADIFRWSLPNLLAYADRNAMAHGVETRLPYLDPRIVAVALAMPDDVLLHGGWTKWPLRVALASRAGPIPAWVRGKRGFGIPQADWLRGPLEDQVRSWLTAPHPAWEAIVDAAAVGNFKAQWRAGPARHSWDDQVFKMVALDRFFHVWAPAT